MKELPQYFVIKKEKHNSLWEKYIQWINKQQKSSSFFTGTKDMYYGQVGHHEYNGFYFEKDIDSFKQLPQIITLAEWDNIVNKKYTIEELNSYPTLKVAVKINNKEEWDEIKKVCNKLTTYREHYLYYLCAGGISDEKYKEPYYINIAMDQIDFNTKINKDMNTKLLGWMIKPECKQYEGAAATIGIQSHLSSTQNEDRTQFTTESSVANRLRAAGVLELWFNPVYEEQYKVGDHLYYNYEGVNKAGGEIHKIINITPTFIISHKSPCLTYLCDIGPNGKYNHMFRLATKEEITAASEQIVSVGGQFNVTICDGKVFHGNSEDITAYVKGIITTYSNISIAGYAAEPSEVIFSRTGCMQKTTKLSDWKKVYDLIK